MKVPVKTMALRVPVYITFFLISLLSFSSVKSQNVDAAIAAYATAFSPERAYFHYDKSAYSAGETIWFKAYLMNEIVPANESKTLYIDWIDDKGKLILHAVRPLADAVTNGMFEVPADYKGKMINVRAYTRWMLNFDSAFIYYKAIPIIAKEATTGQKAAVTPVIQFFPEGGDMIAGLPNKIAFKANDQWGRPVKVKGIVTSNKNKVEDSIRTLHDGMGYFLLTPQEGVTYSAKWKDEKNVERTTALPKTKNGGAVLQVAIEGTSRIFSVSCTPDFIQSNDSVYLVGTLYQHQVFRVARATGSAPIKGMIPIASLPSGIMTITLFDKSWKPIAERITYINNGEFNFQPQMEVQRWGLNKRARNELKISVPDSLVSSLSISVTDAAIGSDSSNNIVSHLMLSSELKGEIYNPAYYFSNSTADVAGHLDLVMLTHGWRRFNWDQVLSGKIQKPKFEKDTSYITLSGKLQGVLPSQIGKDADIVLLVKQADTDSKMFVVPVQPNGTFNDPEIFVFDTAQIYYTFQKGELKDASVQFMTDRLPATSLNPSAFTKPYGLFPDTTGSFRQWKLADEANSISEMMKVKTLEAVIVKSKLKTPIQLMDEKYASGLFSGGDAYQFDLINDPFAASSINIFYYLQGKVPGLQVNTTANPPTLSWRGGSPQLYLDQMNVDPGMIATMSIHDVAYIKVFRPPFMGGFNGGSGGIAIFTKRGNDSKPEPGKGLPTNKIFGYNSVKEFYSPNYATFNQRNEQRDIRTTLYWNPSVTTASRKNNVVVSFYNNDVSQSFRVVIEGMTTDGRLAHIEQIME